MEVLQVLHGPLEARYCGIALGKDRRERENEKESVVGSFPALTSDYRENEDECALPC